MDEKELLNHPKIRAMLNVIRTAEGADYNTRVGGEKFSDLSKKPGQKVFIKNINDYSTAEGAYQFLNKTWEGVSKKLGLKDFSPYSQDLAAVHLIKQRGAIEDILNDNFELAINKLSKEWASLPTAKGVGAYKGQKARKIDYLKKIYGQPIKEQNNLNNYKQNPLEILPINTDLPQTNGIVFTEEDSDSQPNSNQENKQQDILTEEDKLLLENFAEEEPNIVNQESFKQEPIQYNVDLTPIEYQPIEQYQDGGNIPISSKGLWEYPNQKVIVPTGGNITMRNVNYPVLGTSLETGETKLMQPEKNYFFNNTKNVLEIPYEKK